ncbi:MAG: sugar transferase [Roseomonas sp.]|nr:sugar transferase [Roseomonas sp.]MCA3328570.1 sugar transferase [Roseomonas sp.]MCA3331561.1 sugar transferase [Roseomonas sp.]MCA3336396.1 sugar transferase [Roseomonas sp.]MCA3346194.1 sugar transferase [Roseomonas sp.]
MYAPWGKAWLDRVVAALVLVLGAPVFALLALAVLLALGRPILFRQSRAGRHGAPFMLLKFRSMREGSGSDAVRLGRFGRWLRASGLDELPQMINILRGEMSLVGPRPLPCDYTPLFSATEARRLWVTPGLFGLAQAEGRNAVPWAHRLVCDVQYAQQAPEFTTDLKLAMACAALLLRGHGATMPGYATSARFADSLVPGAAPTLTGRNS